MKLAIVVALCGTARADDRSAHLSAGIGGALLFTGNDGTAQRAEVELDVEPGGAFGRFGALVALRGFDPHHAGLLCGGLVFEAAASRPGLIMDLHADAGADLDHRAPLAGGGLRTTIGITGPLAVALDSGAYLVLQGFDHTRLVLMGAAALALRW